MSEQRTFGDPLSRHLAGVCRDDCGYCAKRRRIESEQRAAALMAVAHHAWHLLDDGGEDAENPGLIHVSQRNAALLFDALDALEASGWDAHPDDEEAPAGARTSPRAPDDDGGNASR